MGQEGIDLHRECRHIIHHDLCWNPATIEQRTGRMDRIGSKVERERIAAGGAPAPTLEIAVPYLAATYDERMFEELYRRAQLFEVTMGGDLHVDGTRHLDADSEEDLGVEAETAAVDLPPGMVERLRIDLSISKA